MNLKEQKDLTGQMNLKEQKFKKLFSNFVFTDFDRQRIKASNRRTGAFVLFVMSVVFFFCRQYEIFTALLIAFGYITVDTNFNSRNEITAKDIILADLYFERLSDEDLRKYGNHEIFKSKRKANFQFTKYMKDKYDIDLVELFNLEYGYTLAFSKKVNYDYIEFLKNNLYRALCDTFPKFPEFMTQEMFVKFHSSDTGFDEFSTKLYLELMTNVTEIRFDF